MNTDCFTHNIQNCRQCAIFVKITQLSTNNQNLGFLVYIYSTGSLRGTHRMVKMAQYTNFKGFFETY